MKFYLQNAITYNFQLVLLFSYQYVTSVSADFHFLLILAYVSE
jgi:hypothetical protein